MSSSSRIPPKQGTTKKCCRRPASCRVSSPRPLRTSCCFHRSGERHSSTIAARTHEARGARSVRCRIAHELNNPLQSVLGHLELLRRSRAAAVARPRHLVDLSRGEPRCEDRDRLLVFAGAQRRPPAGQPQCRADARRSRCDRARAAGRIRSSAVSIRAFRGSWAIRSSSNRRSSTSSSTRSMRSRRGEPRPPPRLTARTASRHRRADAAAS